MKKSKKLVIGKVAIVRVGNEIRYNVPEDMTGKQLSELRTKHSEVINDFIESTKQDIQYDSKNNINSHGYRKYILND